MSQRDCTSESRLSRLRSLVWLVGTLLLSSPAWAEETADAEPATEQTEVESASALPPEQGGKDDSLCTPVRLADSAMLAPAAPPPASKASAILGGELSSLDRIRMAQSGQAMPAIAQAQPLLSIPANLGGQISAPADAAPLDPPSNSCIERLHAAPSAASIIADNRQILGSLRLSIRKTPFDQKWSKISQTNPARGMKRWLARTGAAIETDPRAQVAAINSWVNGRIAYADDIALYRQNDFWASSRETLRRGKGDCEDYAILKMDLLAAMGIDRDKMILVVARDLVRNADHALLIVQLDDGPVVLDNSTDQLLDGRLANDYRPIMSFASNGKWLHGYAVAVAPPRPAPAPAPVVTIAALSAPSMPAIALSTPVSAGN